MTTVKLQFMGTRFRTPPFVDLVFDAVLANGEAGPLWFLLPSYLREDSGFGEFRVSSVEVFEPPGTGRVRIARFIGSAGFQALRLPSRAEVRIHGLPVSVHGEPPERDAAIPVLMAGEVMIGKEAAERWLPVDVLSGASAEVKEEPGAIVASRDTPDLKEVVVTLSRVRTLAVPMEMRKR